MPCKLGHVERYLSTDMCVMCTRAASAKYAARVKPRKTSNLRAPPKAARRTHDNGTLVYDGSPCAKCGNTERYDSSGECCRCKLIKNRAPRNREREKELARKRREQDPSAYIQASLRFLYGLDLPQLTALFEAQSGECAICRCKGHLKPRKRHESPRAPDEFGRVRLCIDHCHTTKAVRGLVCHSCNIMVGNHSSELLRAAASYVERNTTMTAQKGEAA